MTRYIIKRFIQMIPTLFGVSLLIFFLFATMPGTFIDANPKLSASRVAELKELYGFNKPIIVRYGIWLKELFHGNLGYSIQFQEPVTDLLKRYVWNSFIIGVAATILSWSLALFIGIMSAIKHKKRFDNIASIVVFIAMSFPSFFLAFIMLKIFAFDLEWFPLSGMRETGSDFTGIKYVLDVIHHMILPVLVLTALGFDSLSRYFRSSMLDVIKMDFVRTARAKGLKERTVYIKHALRNAILPGITILGFQLPGLFSGALIIETIFTWPGIGGVNLNALSYRDYPVLMAFTMALSFLTVFCNFLADVAYSYADPRIKIR